MSEQVHLGQVPALTWGCWGSLCCGQSPHRTGCISAWQMEGLGELSGTENDSQLLGECLSPIKDTYPWAEFIRESLWKTGWSMNGALEPHIDLNFVLPCTSHVTLGQLLHLSEPQCCLLQNRVCDIVLQDYMRYCRRHPLSIPT